MFAIIEDGSRQYRVEVGRRVSLDFRATANEGDTLTFDKVMLANGGVASVIGKPLVEGATVTAEVVTAEEKGEKLEIQKIRRRKNSRRHTGHRQKYTLVNVTAIDVPGLEIVEPKEEEHPFAADAAMPEPVAETTETEAAGTAED